MRSMNASEFKARCLALLEEVQQTGEIITILKRGKPVACVSPAREITSGYPQDALKGTVKILGDVMEPVIAPEAWELEKSTLE